MAGTGSETDPLVIKLRNNAGKVLKVHQADTSSTLAASSTMFSGTTNDGTIHLNDNTVQAYAPGGFRTDTRVVTPEIDMVLFKNSNAETVSTTENPVYTKIATVDVSRGTVSNGAWSRCCGWLFIADTANIIGQAYL